LHARDVRAAGASAPGARPGAPLPEPPDAEEKLRDIRAITDSRLSLLDPQELLDELVARVREALQVDTVVVLLADRSRRYLIATSSSGLEEEVLQGVRVPMGKGFAGRIAATALPVILDEVSPSNVVNPLLLDKGLKSMMGAPLLAEGLAIGVIHVGSFSPRTFSQHDLDLLQLTADRAAMSVQAAAARMDRAAATALQRSLLPSALPDIPGLEIAARYVPGSGRVGGDWYDVFPLPSGETCAVIGDVTGSGLRAAAIMGRARSALRAYALETSDPAEILERLDHKMRYFEPEGLLTVQCAVITPGLDRMRVSSAGHPPPIIRRPGHEPVLAEVAPDVLIGIPALGGRRVTSLELPVGAVLCMYTDGLVERRGQPIDEGLDRLRRAVTGGDPEAGCAAVMAAMADSSHVDDVALLMFRRVGAERNGQPVDVDPR
jgi:phosphoserine phosphatase RsbU/P